MTIQKKRSSNVLKKRQQLQQSPSTYSSKQLLSDFIISHFSDIIVQNLPEQERQDYLNVEDEISQRLLGYINDENDITNIPALITTNPEFKNDLQAYHDKYLTLGVNNLSSYLMSFDVETFLDNNPNYRTKFQTSINFLLHLCEYLKSDIEMEWMMSYLILRLINKKVHQAFKE